MTRGWQTTAVAAMLLTAAACGKKGPPLPPLVRIPMAVTQMTAQRLGDDVYVTVTLPERNIDGSQPVATESVDVWAYSGRSAPARGRWADQGTLVGRVPVPKPAADEAVTPVEAPRQIAVHEHLTEAPAAPEPDGQATGQVPGRRFYVAIPTGAKGRPGAPGLVADVDLGPRPAAPSAPDADFDATRILVTWGEAGDQEAFAAAVRAQNPGAVPEAGAWTYNVYRAPSASAVPPPAQPGVIGTSRPRPLNPSPLATRQFSAPVTFDVETCVVVRAVFTSGGRSSEGNASEPACVTPVDRFPPAAPRQLVALPSAEAIELLWDANDEPDLAGYHVWRSEGGGPARRLTDAPLPLPRFRDVTVKPGVKYSYAVVAVDTHLPTPNISAESNRVEEEAR